jgi:hypothetical protein
LFCCEKLVSFPNAFLCSKPNQKKKHTTKKTKTQKKNQPKIKKRHLKFALGLK